MIIVAGTIYTAAPDRNAFVESSREAVVAARQAPGCHDFVVAADPVEADRVNVYERWETDADVEAFRGEGPGDDLSSMIVRADVSRYEVAAESGA